MTDESQEMKKLDKLNRSSVDINTKKNQWKRELRQYKQRVRDYFEKQEKKTNTCHKRAEEHSRHMSRSGNSDAFEDVSPLPSESAQGEDEQTVGGWLPANHSAAQQEDNESPPEEELTQQDTFDPLPDYDTGLRPPQGEQATVTHVESRGEDTESGRRGSKSLRKRLSGLFKKKDGKD